MDVLSVGKERIFPHQVSCLILAFHVCKVDEENELAIICKKCRRQVILLLLDLIQRIHLDYESLLRKLEHLTTNGLAEAFEKRMLSLVENKYIGMLDFFDSLEALTLSGNNYAHRSSLFGIFIRKMFLNYQKMTFSDTGELGKSLESYLTSNEPEEMQDLSFIDTSMEIEAEIIKSKKSGEEMETVTQAGRFISLQTRLLESQIENPLSARELHEKIQDILQKFPSISEAYYLSYLNQLQIGEVRNALFDLHRYFDYKKWDDDQANGNGETEKTSLEKHQMKFKRFRYCALNLGMFHFYHGHDQVSLAALEEAVKMAQETNDNQCLLHALFWLYQLKLGSDPKLANSMLIQFNRRAKDLGALELQGLGTLLECKNDAFSGRSPFEQVFDRLKELDTASATKSGVSSRKIQVARSAVLDFFGYRPVASYCSQVVLYGVQGKDKSLQENSFLYEPPDPESSILAICQFAKVLSDEGYFLDAQNVIKFGSTLIGKHSSLQKWLILCKWQLVFDRCLLKREIEETDDVIKQINVLDRFDASLKECIVQYLKGNIVSAASRIESLLDEVENRLQTTVGNTPGTVYNVRLLQLKAELLASSGDVPKAVSALIRCTHVCRQFGMKTLEAEVAISIAQCKILLGLPHHAKQIINRHMVHILSYGTLYTRSLVFLVMAKASIFNMKGVLKSSKSGLLQHIPSLEKSLQGFQNLEAKAAQSELLFLMAQIYNILEYTTERNHFAKEFRMIHENVDIKHPVKLFI